MSGWFAAPLKWLPQPLTAVGLSVTLNLFFQRYPELKARLAELSGKVFQFDVEDLQTAFFMVVDEGGEVRIHTYSDTVAHVTMAGSSQAFLALLFNTRDPDSLFFARELKLSGETDTGLHFKNILDNVEIDWQRELAPWMGEKLAGVTVRSWTQMQQALGQGAEKVDAGVEEWMAQRSLPRQAQWNTFRDDLDDLVERSERVARAIGRVEKKRALALAMAAGAEEQPSADNDSLTSVV
ncbi:ubiquinone anaerobic biosynthesis accessory factor UbiT [Candidatus Magnetaquicoccus inordinatus]|uniref:ubiquinone anaerobic biosynthesis accessory factor UbiT n=1 Tax=Candidatus Magnetaquicoccus inordinatus TaxID=2496818 RepID=UPI00187D6C62|nr:SCP2 sterol-binding domain-containing protein [Candidatus Magnetaquicoccus inordinatus]